MMIEKMIDLDREKHPTADPSSKKTAKAKKSQP